MSERAEIIDLQAYARDRLGRELLRALMRADGLSLDQALHLIQIATEKAKRLSR